MENPQWGIDEELTPIRTLRIRVIKMSLLKRLSKTVAAVEKMIPLHRDNL